MYILLKRGLWRLIMASTLVLNGIALHADENKATAIMTGKTVSIEYTLKLDDGTTVVSNVGEKPLLYTHGEGQILPKLERELTGLQVNDTKKVSLAPADAFGAVDPKAFVTVPPDQVPEEAREVGSTLVIRDTSGSQQPVTVHEIKEDGVTLNLNHPLAGKQVIFEITVLAVE